MTPLVLPRRLFPQALEIEGDRGLRDLVNGSTGAPRLLDLPSAVLDVDTPGDLRRARRQLRNRA